MNINDILEKVTLQLPGGGKLPLNKYSKYITNGEATVEGLAEGSLFDFDPTYKPVKYLANVPKDVDAVIAEWDFDKTIKTLNEWKIFTEDELKEYVNNINEIVGNKRFSFNIGDQTPSIFPLYSEEVPENTTIQIGIYLDWEMSGFVFAPLYTNNPVEITESLTNGEMGDYTDEELDFLNANVINEGLHIYFDSKVVNDEEPDEFTEEEVIESISKYFVKIYDNGLNGNNINLYFYDINNEDQLYECNIGNGNGDYDNNTDQHYCWAPIGTFYVTTDNGDAVRINDGNNGYPINTDVNNTSEITFDQNHNYNVYIEVI